MDLQVVFSDKQSAHASQVAALKRSFYSSPELSQDMPNDRWDRVLGLMKDMPLCRWENVILPGYNQVLNVWQPMYTHMFGKRLLIWMLLLPTFANQTHTKDDTVLQRASLPSHSRGTMYTSKRRAALTT